MPPEPPEEFAFTPEDKAAGRRFGRRGKAPKDESSAPPRVDVPLVPGALPDDHVEGEADPASAGLEAPVEPPPPARPRRPLARRAPPPVEESAEPADAGEPAEPLTPSPEPDEAPADPDGPAPPPPPRAPLIRRPSRRTPTSASAPLPPPASTTPPTPAPGASPPLLSPTPTRVPRPPRRASRRPPEEEDEEFVAPVVPPQELVLDEEHTELLEEEESEHLRPLTPIPPAFPDAVTAEEQRERRSRQLVIAAIVAGVVVAAAAGIFALRSDEEPLVTPAPPTAATQAPDIDPVALRYKFDPGEVVRYTMSVNSTVSPRNAPEATPVTVRTNSTLVNDVVTAAEDGSAVLDLSLTDVRTTPPTRASPTGDKMRISLAGDGRVTAVEGDANLFGPSAGSSFSATTGGAVTDSASAQFLFPRFASNAVRPGDTWTTTSTFPVSFGGRPLTATTSGKLEEFATSEQGQTARIHEETKIPIDMTISFSALAKELAAQGGTASPSPIPNTLVGARLKITGSIDATSDSLVLTDTGEVLRVNGTVTTSIETTVTGAPTATGATASPNVGTSAVETKLDISLNRQEESN